MEDVEVGVGAQEAPGLPPGAEGERLLLLLWWPLQKTDEQLVAVVEPESAGQRSDEQQ